MHHRNNNKAIVLLLTLLLSCSAVLAQQTFKYRVVLPKVDSSGFFIIPLMPDVVAKSNKGLSDIRLFDQNKKIVPYISGNEMPIPMGRVRYINLPLSNIELDDTATTYVVKNLNKIFVKELHLELRNADVTRSINISGSDDNKKWYAIKENVPLTQTGDNRGGVFGIKLNIPPSNYRYLRLKINNNHKDEIAILQVGVYKTLFDMPEFFDLNVSNFRQTKTGKKSHLIINFKDAYQVNKIHLGIESPKFFKREVNIYELINGKYILTGNKIINSVDSAQFDLGAKARSIKLEIFNEDNPPLNIVGVKAYQETQKLVSYLEKDKQYHLLFGDSAMRAPNYDLKFFLSDLQQALKMDDITIENNPLYKRKQLDKPSLPSWIIWVAIAIVLSLLIWFTLKLTKEVGNRSSNVD